MLPSLHVHGVVVGVLDFWRLVLVVVLNSIRKRLIDDLALAIFSYRVESAGLRGELVLQPRVRFAKGYRRTIYIKCTEAHLRETGAVKATTLHFIVEVENGASIPRRPTSHLTFRAPYHLVLDIPWSYLRLVALSFSLFYIFK